MAELALAAAQHQAAQRQVGIGSYDLEEVLDVPVTEPMALVKQELVVGKDVFYPPHGSCLALDFKAVFQQVGGHAQGLFEKADVFVTSAEQGSDAVNDRNARFRQLRQSGPPF